MTVATGRLRSNNSVDVTIARDFDDPRIGADVWAGVPNRGIDEIFTTRTWQSTWWRSFGRGELLVARADVDGAPVALAPLFADAGMLYFVGSSGSDYLDFVGDVDVPRVLETILESAIGEVPDFVGARFYHVPDESPAGARLGIAARHLGLDCYDEGNLAAPWLDARGGTDALTNAARKKSLVRHQNYFHREGELEVVHAASAEEIEPYLDEFFDQHISRWAQTEYPSLFLDDAQRDFYRALTHSTSKEGWLRFTRILWNGAPIAMHFGFLYSGSFLWYKPTYAIDLARRSPGEVLMRQLLLSAAEQGATKFDLGLGDEAFKERFATDVRTVRTWGLYPHRDA